MAGIPRLQFAHVDLLVRSFGTLQGLLAASANDLQSVEGIGSMWARHVREGLSQLAEATIAEHGAGATSRRARAEPPDVAEAQAGARAPGPVRALAPAA